jgi:hypothetical protein
MTKPLCNYWRPIVLGVLLLVTHNAASADRHAGYYYPQPESTEMVETRGEPLPGSDRRRRILFVTEMTRVALGNPYPPDVAIFAKGAEAEKLIITALGSGRYDTLYRMRGLLALLTAEARRTPIFQDLQVEDVFTFLDLLGLLGFEQLTLTDGNDFAHRIQLQ